MPQLPGVLTIGRALQLGVESTIGTNVPANKILPALGVLPMPQQESSRKTPPLGKLPTEIVVIKDWVGGTWEMPSLCFSGLTYILASYVKLVSPSAPADTTAYTWTFAPTLNGAETVQSYSAEVGDAVYADEMSGVMFDEPAFVFKRDEVSAKGKILGRTWATGASMTGGASTVPSYQALPIMGYLKLGSAWQPSGSPEYALYFGAELNMGSRYGHFWPQSTSTIGPGGVSEVPTEPEFTMTLGSDATGMAYLATLRAGTPVYARIGYTASSALGGTPYLAGAATAYHSLLVDLSLKIESVEELGDMDGLRIVKFKCGVRLDAANKSYQFTLVNKVASL
jgi:hypothetical protein